MNKQELNKFFEDKRVVIIGGTGSFGTTMTERLLKTSVSQIAIVSRDEEKQLDMKRKYKDNRLEYWIGDVKDIESLYDPILNADIVYHAAALKIIPVCEEQPAESIKTNLDGTINVKQVCIDQEVSKGIFISTDKAVKPVNVYGMCKALAERMWLDYVPGSEIDFVVTRYGNVIKSRGSVIPFFKQLIRKKKPLQITDYKMTRFLLTLNQATDLVFKATKYGNDGQIYVPKIPTCRIVDLARAMTNMDYPIEYIGIRPGEKIDEVLISEEEIKRTEDCGDYYRIHPYDSDIFFDLDEEYTSANAQMLNRDEIKELIK